MSGTGALEPQQDQPVAPEEQARANFYGLVGRLFYGPADPNLLAEISRNEMPDDATPLGLAWHRLQEACRSAFPAVVRQEYDTLFIGVGRSEVTPYLSGYVSPSGPDRMQVRLREQLGKWGLSRREGVFEMEDHVSGLCDVMRWLIASGKPLWEQRAFFQEYLYPGALPFIAATQKAPSANFYGQVALFAQAFFELEHAAFEMSDSAD